MSGQCCWLVAPVSRRVCGLVKKLSGASRSETDPGADLGGSSNYSNGTIEDWSGEGFYVNSGWT